MTLCIAAHCREENLGPGRVVLGFDWKIETDTASAETEFKFEYIGDRWCALIAGPVGQARELVDRYRAVLTGGEKFLGVLDQLRKPVLEFREILADRYVHKKLAVSYERFLEHGKNFFPRDLRNRVANEIENQTVEAEIILVGLVERHFVIAVVTDEVGIDRDFAVIGSGSDIAFPALCQREQHYMRSLRETVYSVYEAKRLGEIAPGVGKQTSVLVLSEDKEKGIIHETVTPEDLEFLGEQFTKFGPQPLRNLKLPPSLEFTRQLKRSNPESTKADPSPSPASPELPEGSDES